MSSSEEEEDEDIQRMMNHDNNEDSDDDNHTSTRRQRNRQTATASESPIGEHDENTFRIMLSTDNHLGYCEGDAIRGMDSFAALEEVLWLARHYQADMVLLAGDLFHQNKPSRGTLHKTMDLFRRYCMGDDPIQIQILSNQSQNFRNGMVNYEDENYSVDLPVFSIHGNHDDPTREAGSTDLFCALDLLDVTNLVNYFGKQEKIDQVQVSPILMKKGTTHLALYGLGSMRDERLHRMWRSQQLKFLRPEPPSEDSSSAWFNLFALHQNRDFGRGTKNCIQETMIPEWMDLVVWGHEHESCVEPRESVVGTFRISQPGSSVATSLSAGEAERKQIGILDIRGTNYRIQPIPLTQVRSFTRGDVNLADIEGLNPDGPKVDSEVTEVLDDRVRVLVHDAREKIQEMMEEAEEKGNVLAAMEDIPLKYRLQKPDSVLVRLNVDHSGFSVLNNQRFGAKFVGEVANPTDILLYSRKKAAAQKKSTKLSEVEPIEPDELKAMKIQDIIVGELENAEQKMEVFDENRINNALESYVDKHEAQAINDAADALLTKEQKKLIKKRSHTSKVDPDSAKKEPATSSKKRGRKAVTEENESEDEPPSPPPKKKRASRASPKKKAPAKRKTAKFSDSEIEEVEDDDSPPPRKKKSAGASRARQKKQPKYTESSDEEIEEVEPPPKRSRATTKRVNRRAMSDSDDDDDIEVLDDPPPTKKRPRRSTASTSSSKVSSLSQSQLSFAPVKRKSRKAPPKGRLYSNDDSDGMEDGWGTAKTDTNDP